MRGRHLQGQVQGQSGLNDSFFVTVDETTYLWDVAWGLGGFASDQLNDRYTKSDPLTLDLAPGDHTIIIELREPGTRLDSFVLTKPK